MNQITANAKLSGNQTQIRGSVIRGPSVRGGYLI